MYVPSVPCISGIHPIKCPYFPACRLIMIWLRLKKSTSTSYRNTKSPTRPSTRLCHGSQSLQLIIDRSAHITLLETPHHLRWKSISSQIWLNKNSRRSTSVRASRGRDRERLGRLVLKRSQKLRASWWIRNSNRLLTLLMNMKLCHRLRSLNTKTGMRKGRSLVLTINWTVGLVGLSQLPQQWSL